MGDIIVRKHDLVSITRWNEHTTLFAPSFVTTVTILDKSYCLTSHCLYYVFGISTWVVISKQLVFCSYESICMELTLRKPWWIIVEQLCIQLYNTLYGIFTFSKKSVVDLGWELIKLNSHTKTRINSSSTLLLRICLCY